MRFSQLSVMVAAIAAVVASPTKFKRGINCASTDKDGTALTGSSADANDDFATCTYKDAGPCTYFFADGSFSSGSSTCPKGLPQDAASTGSSNTGTSSTSSSSASTGSISPNINCAPTDKDGTALTSSSADSSDDFATCTYKDAGPCTYFFADGSFSSGSSTCPKGLPQTGGSGSGSGAATTTSTTAAQTTTAAPPPPPPVTTSSTSTPPPPETTTSTTAESTTSTEAPLTSTSTFFSTVQPSSAAAATTPITTAAAATTPAPAAPIPTDTDTDTDTDSFTTVIVNATVTPTGGVANSGSGGAPANGALTGRGVSALGTGAAVLFVWALSLL